MPARLQSSESNRSVPLDKPILFVGRHPECDLVINHSRKVSRKHCCLAEINGQFVVRDLGSTNGVQINGRRVTGIKNLNNGDELIIGDCVYTFLNGAITPETASGPHGRQNQAGMQRDGEDSPYLFDDATVRAQAQNPQDMSSEIPILLDDPEEDGFDVYPGDRSPYRRPSGFLPPRRNRSDSDSHLELAID